MKSVFSDFIYRPFGALVFSRTEDAEIRLDRISVPRWVFIRLRQDTLQLAAERNGEVTAP
jgi:hypothetical protein